VRVLLDENLPHDLIAELPGHDVVTVQEMGWAGAKNADLLKRASGKIAALLTMDRNLDHQHDLRALPFGVIVIRAKSNRIQICVPLWIVYWKR
jgi:predicted nuclease of predicted toxin-antitoxin system